MTKIERTIYNAAIWLYCATSGRNAYRWPTKYGRPIGSAVMRTMVRRSQVRRAFAESGLIDGLDTDTTEIRHELREKMLRAR